MELEDTTNSFFIDDILNSFPGVVFFALDVNYKYLFFNDAHAKEMEKIWGVKIKKGESMLSYIKLEDDRKKAKENFDRALSGESFVLEEAYGDEELNRLYYEINYAPFKNKNNEIIGLTVFLKEVTERIKREKEIKELNKKLENVVIYKTRQLEEDKEKFHLLVDAIEEVVVVHSNGIVLYANEAAKKTIRVESFKDLIGKNIFSFIHKDSKELVKERIQLVQKYGEKSLTPTAEKLLRSDGEIYWAEVYSRQIVFDGKKAILTIIRDLSRKIEAERKFKESEEQLKRLFDLLPEAILVHSEGKVIYVNDTAVRLLGAKTQEELIGKDAFSLVAPDYRKKAFERIKDMENKKQKTAPLLKEKILRLDGKTVWTEVAARNIKFKGKQAIVVTARDLTEKIESEKTIETLIDILPEAIVVHSGGKIIYANSTIAKLIGVGSSAELIGKDVFSLLTPEFRDISLNRVNDLQKGKTDSVPLIKEKLLMVNGDTVWVEVSSRNIKFKGQPAIVSSARDLTERLKAERKLAETHRIYIDAIKNIKGVPYSFNYNSNTYEYIGEGVEQLFGIHAKEFTRAKLASTIQDIVLSNYDLKDPHELTRLMIEGKVNNFNADYRIKTPSGEIKWISDKSVAVKDTETGKTIGSLGIMQDITERKMREAKLKEQEETLRAIFKNSSDGLALLDENNTILDWNSALEEFTGLKREEVLNKDINKIITILRGLKIDGKEESQFFINDIPVHRERKNLETEWKIRSKKGEEIFLLVSLFLVHGTKGNFTGLIIRNITRQKKIEEELRNAAELAEKSNKLKTEFLAQISHEIRTPLNIIMSFSQLIEEELKDRVEEHIKEGFESISKAGKRLIRTVDLILNMSEIQTGSFEPHFKTLDVYEIIEDNLENEFHYLAKQKNLDFNINKEADDTNLVADEYALYQIFSNLIDNAIKYTERGEVKVRIYRDEQDRLTVSVKDTGIGISEEYLPHIFEPFSQEQQGYTRRFEGNGLGMALVKEYCDMNNAEIKVESQKGKGSTFTVIFNPSEGRRKIMPNRN